MQKELEKTFLTLRKEILESEFSRMNDMQRKAVFHTLGPLLILAGAGSGKTTVLVNRISNLLKYGSAYESDEILRNIDENDIEFLKNSLKNKEFSDERVSDLLSVKKAAPWSIMAITFTNKAANELKDRLRNMLGNDAEDIWACTFHSACSRILRKDIDKLDLGYSRSFTIYDTDDSCKLIKQFVKGNDDRNFAKKVVLPAISKAKEKCLSPKAFAEANQHDARMLEICEIYNKYQEALRKANALDFDDMIRLTVLLFEKRPDVLEYYQRRFKYILVDEYQDTNLVQYQLVKLLAQSHKNLCVVGDDDQSIYRFRGATIENILNFQKNYPDATVIRLEQNYRSTSTILKSANEVIANNKGRCGKTLWTKNENGDKINVTGFDDESSESQYIATTILKNVQDGSKFSDHAILYRMNAQSGSIEKALVRHGIPYRIIGGFRFYERLEIKDIMAYLCTINNTNDNLHFERIVNTPKRGIGNATIEAAKEIAEELNISLFDVFKRCDEFECFIKKSSTLHELVNFFERMKAQSKTILPHELIKNVIEESGYIKALQEGRERDAFDRIENLNTLVSNAADYENLQDEPTLEGFLEETSLMTDLDNYDEKADTVVLMTIHSAKGLEFPYVFLAGLENGIFPNQNALSFDDDLEEERRLAYVAITRAKKQLYISYARCRMIFGKTVYHRRSKFIDEIPEIYRNENEVKRDLMKNKIAMQEKRKETQRQNFRIGIVNNDVAKASYKAGEIVIHSVFGEGMIISAKPMGNDTLLEIAFEKYGTKKLMANFAKLKKPQ